MNIPPHIADRAMTYTRTDGECIVSLYAPMNNGYCQISWRQHPRHYSVLVHRLVWMLERGPIPDGLTVDHICRNRRCINVDHLRLLTNVENASDNGFATRTHCPVGHPYDETNTYRAPSTGDRRCRACGRINAMRRYWAKRAA